jgi:hypothetical protein
MDGKRRLLKTLATWLTAINIDAPISDRTRATVAKIAHQFSLDDWSEIRRKQAVLDARLKSASNEARRTEDAYNQAAPWGILSSAFADDVKRKALVSLKAGRDYAIGMRETAGRDVSANQPTSNVL